MATFPLIQRPLYAASVTVNPTPAQNLLTLLQAIGGNYANIQGSCRSWSLQLDPNSPDIAVGDENVVPFTFCGLRLSGGGGFLDRASCPGMGPIGSIFVVAAATTTAQLNVLVFPE